MRYSFTLEKRKCHQIKLNRNINIKSKLTMLCIVSSKTVSKHYFLLSNNIDNLLKEKILKSLFFHLVFIVSNFTN